METQRNIAETVLSLKDKYPIIAITGPRQSGKTTFIKSLFPAYEYVSLENLDLRSFAQNDPRGFLERYNKFCIFDEVQRVPELFSYLQDLVDSGKQMGRFVLSGSQNFNLIQSIKQSLAGRVALFKLFPFDMLEMKKGGFLSNNYERTLLTGFYPAIFDRAIPAKSYFSNYMQTYVERDIAELIQIKDISKFRNFVGLLATRAANVLNLSNLAKECGISSPTAAAWLSLLESSYVVFLLPQFYKNFGKRITQSPKLYFYDTGLLCYLLKIENESQISQNAFKGMVFENYAIAEKTKQNHHLGKHEDYYFWKDSHGNEIDLLIPKATTIDYFEVKCTSTVTPKLFSGLNKFEKLIGAEAGKAHLIYAGKEQYNWNNVEITPWNNL